MGLLLIVCHIPTEHRLWSNWKKLKFVFFVQFQEIPNNRKNIRILTVIQHKWGPQAKKTAYIKSFGYATSPYDVDLLKQTFAQTLAKKNRRNSLKIYKNLMSMWIKNVPNEKKFHRLEIRRFNIDVNDSEANAWNYSLAKSWHHRFRSKMSKKAIKWQ